MYITCVLLIMKVTFLFSESLVLFYRLSSSWEKSRDQITSHHDELFTNPKHILLFPGLVSYQMKFDIWNKVLACIKSTVNQGNHTLINFQ